MQIYVGQARGKGKVQPYLDRYRIGECFTRGTSYWPPRRTPWFYDNGAFGDWQAGRPFDEEAFASDLPRIRGSVVPPAFIVCPDRVAGGLESLAFSLGWLPRLKCECPGLPVYLAVQDGLSEIDVPEGFDGLFVGGTLSWKIATGSSWVAEAKRRGVPCHVGRVGNRRRLAWAKRIGADSIDSSLPLWSMAKLRLFLATLDSRQLELVP